MAAAEGAARPRNTLPARRSRSAELPARRVEPELHAFLHPSGRNRNHQLQNWSTAALSEQRGLTASTRALDIFSAPTPIFIFSKNPLS